MVAVIRLCESIMWLFYMSGLSSLGVFLAIVFIKYVSFCKLLFCACIFILINLFSLNLSKHIILKLTGLLLRVRKRKIIFLFLNQNICCGYSKEPSQRDGSFEHPIYMLKIVGKKIFTILR